MAKLRLPFEVQVGDYEEDMTLPLLPAQLAEFLSDGKAQSVAKKNTDALIIAADSFVVYRDKVMGKPKNEEEARAMLRMLSGKENDIITGVTIVDSATDRKISFCDTTKVFMRKLSEDEIDAYIKTGEPMDKAGAYSIQELGSIFIDRIEGDFFNAMGLPLARLACELKQFGVQVLR